MAAWRGGTVGSEITTRSRWHPPPAVTRATAIAVVVAAAWALAVSVGPYERKRVSVESNQAATATAIELASHAAGFAQPVLVVIARVANPSQADPINLDIRLGSSAGDLQTQARVAAGGTREVALIWDTRQFSGDGGLTVTGDRAGWRLDRLEVSNARGFARGLMNFVIVPATQPLPAPPWSAIVALLLAVALLVRGARRERAPGSRWLWALPWISLPLMFAIAASGLVSPYRVVLEPRTFILLLVAGTAPWAAALRQPILTAVRSRGIVGAAIVTAGAAVLFYGAVVADLNRTFDGNYSGFLRMTHAVADRAPFLSERADIRQSLILYDEGYDGQFMYLMTFDPFLRAFRDEPERYRDVVDFPPYRFGRPAYSVLALALSLGNPLLLPQTMVWLVVVASGVMAGCLSVWGWRQSAPWWSPLLVLAIPGYLFSVTVALPEALATACLLVGLTTIDRPRPVVAIVALGAALLVRETGLVLVAAVVMAQAHRSWQWRAWMLGLSLLPMLIWRFYVGVTLYADWGATAFFPSPGDFAVPLAGIHDLWQAVARGSHPRPEVSAAIAYPLVLGVAGAASVWGLYQTRSAFGAAAVVYAGIALCLNYEKIWSHVPSAERGTHELFLALLLLGMQVHTARPDASRRTWRLFALLALYSLVFSPEAGNARAALLLIR
jgi:hypothetical protein